MADRPRRAQLGDLAIALATALVAAVVARPVQATPDGALPAAAASAAYWLPYVAYGSLFAELAAWPVRRWMRGGSAETGVARMAAWLAMALAGAVRSQADSRAQGPAALAALTLLGLVLPVQPLPGGVLLEASLARRLPQLVAARLAARIGFTAALLVPGTLLLASKIRADTVSTVVLSAVALALVASARIAAANALVLELELQARRDGSPLSKALRRELLARPLPPELARRRPLPPEQFRAFQVACERVYARRTRRAGPVSGPRSAPPRGGAGSSAPARRDGTAS